MARSSDPLLRKEAIARALWHVAVTEGLPAVSMRRVAAAAGVSTGQVQYYFASRDDLVVYAAEQMVTHAVTEHYPDGQSPGQPADADPDELGHCAIPHQPEIPGRGPREAATVALEEAVAHVLQRDQEGRGIALWYSFLAEAVANPRVATALRQAKAGQENHTAALLAGWPGDPPRDAQKAAQDLIALADGLALRVHLGSIHREDALAAIRDQIHQLTHAADESRGTQQ